MYWLAHIEVIDACLSAVDATEHLVPVLFRCEIDKPDSPHGFALSYDDLSIHVVGAPIPAVVWECDNHT